MFSQIHIVVLEEPVQVVVVGRNETIKARGDIANNFRHSSNLLLIYFGGLVFRSDEVGRHFTLTDAKQPVAYGRGHGQPRLNAAIHAPHTSFA